MEDLGSLQMFALELLVTVVGAIAVVGVAFWKWAQRDANRGRDVKAIREYVEQNTETLEEIKKETIHQEQEIQSVKILAETTAKGLLKHEEGCTEREERNRKRFEAGAAKMAEMSATITGLKENVAEVKEDIKSIIRKGCHLNGDE